MFNANIMKARREKNRRKFIKKAIKLITERIKEEVRLGNTFLVFSTEWISDATDSDLWYYGDTRKEVLKHFSDLGFKTISEKPYNILISKISWED